MVYAWQSTHIYTYTWCTRCMVFTAKHDIRSNITAQHTQNTRRGIQRHRPEAQGRRLTGPDVLSPLPAWPPSASLATLRQPRRPLQRLSPATRRARICCS